MEGKLKISRNVYTALAIMLAAALLFCFTGCSTPQYAAAQTTAPAVATTAATTAVATAAVTAASDFDAKKEITVISREDGSGTRSAFIELFEIQVKDADGATKDMTTKEAIIADKTDIMMTNIAGDPYAIGYISLGSVNSTIKPLDIDGIAASAENVKNGSYKIQRPFIIATKGEATGLAGDFIEYILSDEGQQVVSANNYIAVNDDAKAYAGANPQGKLVVAGSSSVTPLMEKLREAYLELNPDVVIEIQMSDSSAGMTAAISGACDIGMSSRELKDTEKADLTDTQIALDGIAVIVNNNNPINDMTQETVNKIFTGEAVNWNDVQK